jgi:hypothetical protein
VYAAKRLLKRIAAVGSVETAQARTDHRRHKTASFCALTDTAMWVELDYQAETLEAAICGAIVTNLGCGMHPREILDQLIARRLIRDPGNNALEDVVQRLADIAEHMKRDW